MINIMFRFVLLILAMAQVSAYSHNELINHEGEHKGLGERNHYTYDEYDDDDDDDDVPTPQDTCTGFCGGWAGECYCDVQCLESNDCCSDYLAVCAMGNKLDSNWWYQVKTHDCKNSTLNGYDVVSGRIIANELGQGSRLKISLTLDSLKRNLNGEDFPEVKVTFSKNETERRHVFLPLFFNAPPADAFTSGHPFFNTESAVWRFVDSQNNNEESNTIGREIMLYVEMEVPGFMKDHSMDEYNIKVKILQDKGGDGHVPTSQCARMKAVSVAQAQAYMKKKQDSCVDLAMTDGSVWDDGTGYGCTEYGAGDFVSCGPWGLSTEPTADEACCACGGGAPK